MDETVSSSIQHKLAIFISEHFQETPSAEKEAELLGALAHQAGGIIAYLGGPDAPIGMTELVLDEFVALVRRGIESGQKIMKGGESS